MEGVECIANGKFYRNPEFKDGVRDCAKYHWCPRGKVLEFKCSAGLWFDVDRQICDFKSKVRNCEKSHGKAIHCFWMQDLILILTQMPRLPGRCFRRSHPSVRRDNWHALTASA